MAKFYVWKADSDGPPDDRLAQFDTRTEAVRFTSKVPLESDESVYVVDENDKEWYRLGPFRPVA